VTCWKLLLSEYSDFSKKKKKKTPKNLAILVQFITKILVMSHTGFLVSK
jgi:hypothetical protein